MAITYAWILNPLVVKPQEGSLTDVVVVVDWRRTAVDGDYSASCYGQVSVGPVDPEHFTPYPQLTQSQVTGWVVTALTPAQVDAYDSMLAEQIENQKNPPTISLSAPWSS